jgi:hypothetical protein
VVLGIALLIGAATGAVDDADFPRPVGTVLLVAVGLALIALGALIWTGQVPLKALVLGNAVSAVAGIIWLAAVSGFSTAGTIVVAITVAGLAVLAAAQAATLRA